MKNTLINRKTTIKIAKALGELCKEVVFVGGAMVSLYIDDKGAEDIRPTKDIDLTFKITTAGQLEKLRQKLNEKGFYEDHESEVICRFKFEDLTVDIMSTKEIGWAPANTWFDEGFHKSVSIDLDDIKIRILSLPYFLASKIDAFFDRGLKDPMKSTDLEDIIYIFNHTSDIVEQIENSEEIVKEYLKKSVQKMLSSESIMYSIPGHLFFENADENYKEIKDKFERLI